MNNTKRTILYTLICALAVPTVTHATKKTDDVITTHVAENEMILPVVRIYDGDTIVTNLTLPPPLNAVSVRIQGIDTPERPAKSYATTGKLGRAKCTKEALLALEATTYLQFLHTKHGGAMTVKNFKYGAYAGRIVGDVYFGDTNVAKSMLDIGYAVPYDGKSKRNTNWCE